MLSAITLATSVLATLAVAQNSSSASSGSSSTASQVMPPQATQSFNPGLVQPQEALSWCQGQRNTCPQICDGIASINRCDEQKFTYECVCQNGTVPDCTAYQQTLPYYICQETFRQCTNANQNNLDGLNQCAQNEVCGTLNASTNQAVTSSSSAGSAATSGAGSAASSMTTSMSASPTSSPSASATGNNSNNGPQIRADVVSTTLIGLFVAAFKFLL